MKAWLLDTPGSALRMAEVTDEKPAPHTVSITMEAVPLLSYTRDYVEGKLPYFFPPGPFTPGTNGVGRVRAVGDGVHHFTAGARVAANPYWMMNEAVGEPAQVLIGLTGISADGGPMLARHPHGTLREVAHFPASTVIPLEGLDQLNSVTLSALSKFAVPFGGLRRSRLAPGETAIVNGASGFFGSAAVLGALALGAERVVAVARRAEPLARLVEIGRGRVSPVVLTGHLESDVKALRSASGGGAHTALDMVGGAKDASSTLAVLKSLRRGGRMVVMGSLLAPLTIDYSELMLNNWELIGNFMYRREDYLALVALVRGGLLDLSVVQARTFGFAQLEAAIDAAGEMNGLQSTVVTMDAARA